MAGYGGKSFKPVVFDGEIAPPPDVAVGKYRFKCVDVEVGSSKPAENESEDDVYPQLIVTWEATKTLENPAKKSQKESVGGEVQDRLTFRSEGDRKGKMTKLQYRLLCDALNLKYTAVPKKITDEEDFAEFIKAIKGKSIDAWATQSPSKDGARIFTNLSLVEPRKTADSDDAPPAEEPEEEPEEEETPGEEEEETPPEEEEEPQEEEEPEPPPPAAKKTAVKTATKAAKK